MKSASGRSVARALGGLLWVLPLGLAACGGGGSDDAAASARAAIDAMKDSLLTAYLRKDPAAIAAFYTEDAIVHDESGMAIVGRPAIQAKVGDLMTEITGYSINSRRLEAAGDLAYEQQTFNVSYLGPDGDVPQEIVGFQLLVLKRQADGAWKIIESGTWNNMPLDMHHDMMGDMPGM